MITESELAEILRLAMDRSNAKVRTVIPARITAFDPTNGPTASVQPVIQAFYWDVDLEEPVAYNPPEITNCPVHYPAGGGFQITYPLDVGDDCFILVAERSIDEWMATGNATNTPRILRRFDLSDAIVIPGLAPRARPLANVDADSLEIRNENGTVIRVNDDGTIYLGNATADAVAELEATVGELQTILTALLVFAASAASVPWTTVAHVATAATALNTALTVTDTTALDLIAIKAKLATISE